MNKRMLQLIPRYTLAMAGALLTACTSNIHVPYSGPDQVAVTNESDDRTSASSVFDYPRQKVVFSNHDLAFSRNGSSTRGTTRENAYIRNGYRLKQIQMPAIHDNGQDENLIRMRYFKRAEDGRKPLVIVVPVYGSHVYPSDKISQGLLKLQPHVNVVLLEYEQHLLDLEGLTTAQTEAEVLVYIDKIRSRVVAGVVDVRRVIDWAELQPDIDPERIALVTFSMSSVVGALLAQHEPRLKTEVIVMGGAHFDDVVTVCYGRLGRAREAVQQLLGWTDQEYRKRVQESLGVLDPAGYPGMANPSEVLMIDAHYDNCIPQASRDALWESLGQPERISYRYAHKKAFLAMTPLGFNVMRRRIYEFIQKSLAPPDP
jgi:dienelactone hydrolase